MARYGEQGGSEYGAADDRDRWRNEDRERSSWRSDRQGTNERDDERGFFERAGDEIRSWFNDEDDDRRPGRDYGRDYERGNFGGGRTSWDRERSGGFPGREREHGSGRTGHDRPNYMNEDRSEFGGMVQGRAGRSGEGNWESRRERGFGPSRGGGRNERSDRDRQGSSSRDFSGFRNESDFRSHRRDHPQSWGEANRGENESLGYGEFRGTLGGFGNQTFASGQDDHYRSWRDRQMSQLDSDYADYCREREQQFNQDFDSWRRNRPSRNPTATGTSPDLGSSSNAGVGTTTASMTGSADAGSASGSAAGQGGTIQSDTNSTETAGSGGNRSGSRSRS